MAHTNMNYVHVDHKNDKNNYNPIKVVALKITTDTITCNVRGSSQE
jgi:hypothetical protein